MFSNLMRELRPAVIILAGLTVITGLAYPLAVTGLGMVFFPQAVAGSLIITDANVIGSRLIGQPFDDPKYFWGRPSATSPHSYNASSSSGSNWGPTNVVLEDAVKQRVSTLQAAPSAPQTPPPVDLVTASGSGLDPHISPAAAYYQVDRVAAARGLNQDAVAKLVDQHVEPRTWGLLGEPRVNVLLLNLALDELAQQ